MKGILAVCGAMVVGALPVHAQDAAKTCSAIEDSLQRLTCFDKLFPRDNADASPANTADEKKSEEATPTPATQTVSAWRGQEEKSPLDDSVIYTTYLTASSASTTGMGRAEAYLVLRCAENTTTAVFSTSLFMMDDNPTVTVRIGQDKATTTRWTRSTSYKSAGLWNGATAIPFIKALPDNERLVVRIEDRDRLDAEFNLGAVSGEVEKLRSHCKW